MKKYKCQDCGNKFILDEFDSLECPKCQNHSLLNDKGGMFEEILNLLGEWKKKKKVFYISIGVLALLLILLFAGCPKKYLVDVELIQHECKIKILVKKPNGRLYNHSNFKYSIDNGNTWQQSNVFNMSFKGQYHVKVSLLSDLSQQMIYAFSNPIIWNIDCGETDKEITDNERISILKVEDKIVNNEVIITVTIDPVNAKNVEYSFTGLDGPWVTNNFLKLPCDTSKREFNIYVRKRKGFEISYNTNPHVVSPCKPPLIRCASIEVVERLINELIELKTVSKMLQILSLFESHNVIVSYSNSIDEPETIYSFLQSVQNVTDVKVEVSNITCNKKNEINQIKIRDKIKQNTIQNEFSQIEIEE